jgi:hypothetical protein
MACDDRDSRRAERSGERSRQAGRASTRSRCHDPQASRGEHSRWIQAKEPVRQPRLALSTSEADAIYEEVATGPRRECPFAGSACAVLPKPTRRGDLVRVSEPLVPTRYAIALLA